MVAYLTDSESHSSIEIEIEKAWHLVSILLRLGRPSRPAELAARCLLFRASPDLVQFLCSIPGSPLFLTEDQFVMISLQVLLSGFSEFASKAVSSYVPRILAWVSSPKRSWDGSVQTYFRKRKGVPIASFLLPTGKRRLLSLPENEEEHQSHSLTNAIQSFSSKENNNAGDDMIIDMGLLPFNNSVKEHALAISEQENAMPHLLLIPDPALSINRLEDVDNKGATETETRCNSVGSGISFRESPDDTCFVECRHSFPSTEVDLNEKIMTNENPKANEPDGELALFTVAMHESICVPHVTGIFRGDTENCVALKTAQIGEQLQSEVTVGNQIKCANKMITLFTEQAVEVEIPANSLLADPGSAQRLPMNSISKQKPLHRNGLASGLEVLSNPLDENKLFGPSKQQEQDKKYEKCIFKKQKSKRSHNNNVPAKEHRADPMPKSNKIFSEPKPLPDFESFFVEEEEGSGGYGTVYRARRRNDGKTFAVKCPHANAHAHHVNNELKMLERFGGRNFVIKYEGSFKSGSSDCFVLEHVEHDRPEVLKREIDVSELQWYGYCLFRALASLHKQGIVHRDVKPGNFLFSRKRCKGYLIDFNLALDLNQKYCTNSKSKMNNNGSLDHVPRPNVKDHPSTKEAAKVAYSRTVEIVSRKVSRDSPHQTNNVKKRVDGGHYKTNDLGSRIKFRSQGADVSGVTSTKDVTSTRTPSAERLREPMPCQGRKELINLVQAALQGPNHDAVSSPVSQRKRVAALPGKPENALVYLSPMPLHSSGIAVAGAGLLKSRGDRKPRREGPCVGTKGFRAPEVLFKSAHQGPKVDVWSAGVTLLYLMIGRTPFVGDPEQNIKDISKLKGSEDLWELAKLHNRESSFPADLFDVQSLQSTDLRVWCELNTRRPDFNELAPWSLFDLVDKCLAVNPRLRISADEALRHEFFAPCHEALRKHRQLKRSLGSESGSQSGEASEP